jgi:hypothetical protein
MDDFMDGYWRDLQQSQPNHIEIVGEKNTIEGSIRDVAIRFCIPYTLGRGYCSIDPRYKMSRRFKASGKSKLILLVLSDFDPEGEDIVHSFARSMRDDFDIDNDDIVAKKVCLTYQQAVERNLPQTFEVKKFGKRAPKFLAKYGERVHELEALPTAERARLLTEAIEGVMDIDAFNHEQEMEADESARIEDLREQIRPILMAATKKSDKTGF